MQRNEALAEVNIGYVEVHSSETRIPWRKGAPTSPCPSPNRRLGIGLGKQALHLLDGEALAACAPCLGEDRSSVGSWST
jgi:hypothetical protein